MSLVRPDPPGHTRCHEILACLPFGPHDVQLDTQGKLMYRRGCDRTRGMLISPYDEPLYEHLAALNAQIAALGARVVVSGLGGDEMVAVGSAESEQAALDKRENLGLPWLGPVARAALPYCDDQIAPSAMADGITGLDNHGESPAEASDRGTASAAAHKPGYSPVQLTLIAALSTRCAAG